MTKQHLPANLLVAREKWNSSVAKIKPAIISGLVALLRGSNDVICSRATRRCKCLFGVNGIALDECMRMFMCERVCVRVYVRCDRVYFSVCDSKIKSM